MNELNLNDIDIKGMSEEEPHAISRQLERDLERREQEAARLEREHDALLAAIGHLERENEELENAVKREKAKIFAWKNPPKYLCEMAPGLSDL